METRSAASFVNGGRGAFIACAALYGLMIAFLGTALFLRISRVASWANLPSLKATELVVVASSLIGVVTLTVQTLVFNADYNTGRCDASHYSMIALTLSKLIFYSFLLQRAIIVLCLGENARRWCYRCAAGGMVVGLSLIVTLTYLPVLQHHALLESGDCLIGHSTAVDVVAVLIDIPSDVGLTVLFLIPVYSAKFEGSRPVAKRTAIACGLTTVTGVCGYVAFFHNSGYLSFWIYHLLSAIMVFVGGASVFYVMSGVDRERSSVRGATAASGTHVQGRHAVSRTLGTTTVGVDTQHSQVFMQVEFRIDVDDARDTYMKESSPV